MFLYLFHNYVCNKILGGPKENRTPINGVTSRYTNHYTMRPNLVEVVGFEPTMFLMWRIYSPLPSTNSAHTSLTHSLECVY